MVRRNVIAVRRDLKFKPSRAYQRIFDVGISDFLFIHDGLDNLDFSLNRKKRERKGSWYGLA